MTSINTPKIKLAASIATKVMDKRCQKGIFTSLILNIAGETSLLCLRKPGPVGQVRDDRLCHLSNLLMVSGVRFQVSGKNES